MPKPFKNQRTYSLTNDEHTQAVFDYLQRKHHLPFGNFDVSVETSIHPMTGGLKVKATIKLNNPRPTTKEDDNAKNTK